MRDLRTRSNDDGTLTLEGVAAPYGESIDYAGVSESFARDAFDPAAAVGAPLLWAHRSDHLIGHVTDARNEPGGLAVTAVVQPTERGRDAQTLLRSGSLRGMSVGFDPVETKRDGDGYQYTRANLVELSLTPLPAYPGAVITATRQKEAAVPETDTREAVDLAPLTARIDQLEARAMERPAAPPRALSVREAFAMQLADAKGGRLRALADVVSSGNAGVLPPSWSSDVLNLIDSVRYLIPRLGQIAFPQTGYVLNIPEILQHTLVGPRGAEKSEIPSRAMLTGSRPFTAAWYAGGVDIAMELISQSDPAIYNIVVDDLFRQYAIVTDQAATDAMVAAANSSGTALDFSSYDAFIAGVLDVSEAIRGATGQPGDRLGLTTASWGKLLGLTGSDGRRILAGGGAQNSDGSANLVATSVNVGGIEVFHSPRLSKDLQFNTVSARVAEKPPIQLTSDNVALMGRDVGILGALIPIPLVVPGIFIHATIAAGQTEQTAENPQPQVDDGPKRTIADKLHRK